MPVMHTETNRDEGPTGHEAVRWLWKEWANVLRVRSDGVPIVGFTWYSLTDQVDWDIALREHRGTVNPRGLCDLSRNLRSVGTAYQELIREWRDVLPTQSVVLSMPLHPASAPHARTRDAHDGQGRVPATVQPADDSSFGGTTHPIPAGGHSA